MAKIPMEKSKADINRDKGKKEKKVEKSEYSNLKMALAKPSKNKKC